MAVGNFSEKVGFVWSVADLLRGDYKQSEYGRVILPFTVLARLDLLLAPTKEAVLDQAARLPASIDDEMKNVLLTKASGRSFYNLSRFTFARMKADPDHIGENLADFVNGFNAEVSEIFIDKFKFFDQIDRLDRANLLYLVFCKFCEIDLHPDRVSNHEMGYMFEELIRRFSEQSNETAGEHFTPREVIRLMVNLLFNEDADVLRKRGIIRTLYDPACGTGGMLSIAEEYLKELNPDARLEVFGQELNPEAFAICKSDMLIKGQNPANIKYGNSFSMDGLADGKFDYFLSNPPFGVEWKKVEKDVKAEHDTKGFAGRFGAGLPRISDGALLFLQHMVSKFQPSGSRLAIVFNGSPLFTGAAGSGESEIRRWLIENDFLETIVAMPDQLFYNTGIATYVWIVTNRKSAERKGKIQLVNAVSYFQKMRKSLGNKRHEIGVDQIDEITRLYGDFAEGKDVKIFDNDEFGYARITVERPLRLRFAVTEEAIAGFKADKAFEAFVKKGDAETIVRVLEGLEGEVTTDRDGFVKRVKVAANEGMKLGAADLKKIWLFFGERDEEAPRCVDGQGHVEPDPELRDYENVPLKEDIEAYFAREVLPHVPDAWIDHSKTKIGYEIPFTRHFYEYTPLRPLEEIEAEIRELEGEIQALLKEVLA